jgi:hypothetical protein
MKALDALNITDDLAASQRGLLTSAQAHAAGVGRMELSRLAASGHLERIARGVYRASGAPSMREEAVWAAWLSMDPGVMSYDRDPLACAVSHNTAAWLMGLGELEPEPVTLTCPARRQVAARGIRTVRAELQPAEVAIVGGLPCTTAARAVADLISSGEDISLVAAVLRDALDAGLVQDEAVLRDRIDALGPKRGIRRGESLWNMMLGRG